MTPERFLRFAKVCLLYNLGVILWGAFVRASGSGAGCGSHWPLCDGEVIPRAPDLAKLIEYSHRLTSGLALLAVLVMWVAATRLFAKGHGARRAAFASLLLELVEALVGAGLVLLRLVGVNDSMARAGWMAVHLANTFLLLGALSLTVYFAAGGRAISWAAAPAPLRRRVLLALIGLALVGASGAVAALGDTLYPAESLAEAVRQDLSPTAHVFVRLRIIHPFLAVAVGLFLLFDHKPWPRHPGASARHDLWVTWLVLGQLALGLVNVALLAPIPIQMLHLLLADLLWIAVVLASAQRLTAPLRT
ncbi:MAG TPA: COX15/CtaA family protein [Thermoanaerobaculia bacterium]|nr:COX15/CtaA family protein [Thermoanaerobaculia bacterium]